MAAKMCAISNEMNTENNLYLYIYIYIRKCNRKTMPRRHCSAKGLSGEGPRQVSSTPFNDKTNSFDAQECQQHEWARIAVLTHSGRWVRAVRGECAWRRSKHGVIYTWWCLLYFRCLFCLSIALKMEMFPFFFFFFHRHARSSCYCRIAMDVDTPFDS